MPFLACMAYAAGLLLCSATPLRGQQIPDVRCQVEDYALTAQKKVQVVVLRDPAREQEARFDLEHGATLVSLRYEGNELLYGHGPGANIETYVVRPGREKELQDLSPYWSAFNPSQGTESMRVPATTAGVACRGDLSLRAFAMMIDGAINNSFQSEPLIGVWDGHVSDHFPPGYSTSFTIETNATWAPNPGHSPRYYLRLDQTVVDVRPGPSRPLEWFLVGSAPWENEYGQGFPQNCSRKTPCISTVTSAFVTGRYRNQEGAEGIAAVVPTSGWATSRAYLVWDVNKDTLLYPGYSSVVRNRTFATVLEHPLEGLSGFHFAWYICAGSWKQAKTFAESIGH